MEDYLIPGTNVLKNIPGITDPRALQLFEEARTWIRIAELRANPIRGTFHLEYMLANHGYIFQDVYVWAGRMRVASAEGPMYKSGSDVVNIEPGDPNAPYVDYAYYPAGPAMVEAADPSEPRY